jgi:hypothetical protein
MVRQFLNLNYQSFRSIHVLTCVRLQFIIGWTISILGILLFNFVTDNISYWRYIFPGMIMYIAGIGAVYITSNFIVVSSASASNQGAAAGVFKVALQVGGSVVGLAALTAVAEGSEKTRGNPEHAHGELSDVSNRSLYNSCIFLSGIGLLLIVFAINVPETLLD